MYCTYLFISLLVCTEDNVLDYWTDLNSSNLNQTSLIDFSSLDCITNTRLEEGLSLATIFYVHSV